MSVQDVRQFIDNGFQAVRNFSRVVVYFVRSIVRERELSRVEDSTDVNTIEAKLQKLDADIEHRKVELKEHFRTHARDKGAVEALELAIGLQKALRNTIQVCNEFLKSNERTDILKQLREFKRVETEVAKIIVVTVSRAKREALNDVRKMFEHENIKEALSEASQVDPDYMKNFADIEKHLSKAETMNDKREWLQILENQIEIIFHSEVNEYSETHESDVVQSRFEKMLLRSQVSLDSRQYLFNLLSALNNLLLSYAVDDKYKEVDDPLQGTIEELSEHFNGWFKAYNNNNRNANIPVLAEDILRKKVVVDNKPTKTVRFATEATVQRLFVDDDGVKTDQSFGVEKVKFGSRFPGLKSLASAVTKTTTRLRRGSTVAGTANKQRPGTRGV